MNYNNANRSNSTVFPRVMCAIVFILFSWIYLFYFQADILAVAQHVLSGGVTTYDKTVGAILITAVLMLLQLLVYGVFRLGAAFHALTYLPSMIILAVITDISADIDNSQLFLVWCVVLPLLLVLSGVIMFLAGKLQPKFIKEPTHLFSRTMWVSMLLMLLMIVGVCSVSNTNAVFHYRVKAESCLIDKDYEAAAEVGIKSMETDSSLTMIRAFALACNGELGDKLFAYPVKCSGNALIPMPMDSASIADGKITTTRFMRYPLIEFYKKLGACPAKSMRAIDFLHLMERRGKATQMEKDYVLTIHLVDCDLDGFVKDLRRYYENVDSIGDLLPRYYREALTLYRHQRTAPVIKYYNEVMEADYKDFQDLLKKYDKESEKMLNACEYYAGSYWRYYEEASQGK